MKIDWNSKYNTISVYAFLVMCAVIMFYLSLSQINVVFDFLDSSKKVLQPFILGFSIAYILNFVLKFYEERVLENKYIKKIGLKSKRGIALFMTYISTLVILALLFKFVLPQLLESITGLTNDASKYINEFPKYIDESMRELNISKENYEIIIEYVNRGINYTITVLSGLIPVIGTMLGQIASSIWNIVIGIVISIYMLIDKEKFFAISKKITIAFFSKEKAERVIELTHRSNNTFGKFLSGKILDSTIIGLLMFIILTIFNMPYALLVSVIIGISNIIPFFGPFIGAIPAFIIILFISPIKALWFLLIIFIVQQIDGNIIGPKILGDSIGISAFWILFSIMVAGKLLGFVGMVIGVPLFAVIYSIIKEIVEARLKQKGLDVDTKKYI